MKKILVVDDDPTIRKLVSEMLAHAGYEVVAAKDGIDAMLMLKADRPDLMVLDVMMPEFNGYDVCHKLKFNPEFKDLPIVLLTSREQELDPKIGNIMKIDYLHKSCSPHDLVNKVDSILKK